MNEPQNPPWTPGPWYVDADYPCNVSTAEHRTIAETCDSYFTLEISRANARLIAAAPELVAALDELSAWAETILYRTDVGRELYEDIAPLMNRLPALLARIRGPQEGTE